MSQQRRQKTKRRGFTHAGGLLSDRVRRAGATRGFAETRLLTDWTEIVGSSIAAIATPAKVSYAKGGLGATLTLSAKPGHGPELQMQLPKIREQVNACYGYNAISRIRITQTESDGFAEPAVPPLVPDTPQADPGQIAELGLDKLNSNDLRAALESLSQHVLSKRR